MVQGGYDMENKDQEFSENQEEFHPKGTLFLLLLYFLVLGGLWIFMYFVEFMGKGPSIIGS